MSPPPPSMASVFRLDPKSYYRKLDLSAAELMRLVAAIRSGGPFDDIDQWSPASEAGCEENLLLLSARSGFTALVTSLLDAGASVDVAYPTGVPREQQWYTPLLAAIDDGHFGTAMALLERGADPNRASPASGATPLHFAASARHGHGDGSDVLVIVQRLIELGADVNAGDDQGLVPLHCSAASDARVACTKALLDAGADPLAVDSVNGFAPIVEARNLRNPKTVALLRAAAAPLLEGKPGSAIAVRRRKKPFDVTRDGGVRTFLESLRPLDMRHVLLLVRAVPEPVTSWLARSGARVVTDATKKLVLDDGSEVFCVLRLRAQEWTVAVLELGTMQHDTECRDHARELSAALSTESVAFVGESYVHYSKGVLCEESLRSLDALDDMDDADEATLRAAERDQHDALDRWFAERGILVPPLRWAGDGHRIVIELGGIKKSDVDHLDVLLLPRTSDEGDVDQNEARADGHEAGVSPEGPDSA